MMAHVRELRQMPAPLRLGETGVHMRRFARIWGNREVCRLQFRLNPRLSATIARLLPSEGIVEINLSVPSLGILARREVFCHEAAHFVVWQRHGRAARPHGPEWAALVKLAGFEPQAARVRCGQRNSGLTRRNTFRHLCPVCHYSKRAARPMSRWRCPECRAIGLDGKLRILTVVR